MLSSRFQDGSRNTSCNHTTLCQTQWVKNNNFSLSDYSPANQENSQVASVEFQHRWKQAGRMKRLWGWVRAQGWNNDPNGHSVDRAQLLWCWELRAVEAKRELVKDCLEKQDGVCTCWFSRQDNSQRKPCLRTKAVPIWWVMTRRTSVILI